MRVKPYECIRVLGVSLALALFIGASGCGMLADPDRTIVAELDGKPITRAKLFGVIYDMPDDKRPRIRSRQDYLRVLNSYIDEEIKIPLGQQLADEGKIEIPREIAREAYFQSIPDETEQRTQRVMWETPVPEPGEESELMEIYNISAQDLSIQKEVIEQGTDQILEQLLGDRAVTYLALEAYRNKELTLDEEILKLEYELAKDKYKTFERIAFLGIQFPTTQPGASGEAAQVRERVTAGESFERIVDEYLAKDMQYGIESVIENNPGLARFRGFWQEASGAKVGDVRGPVFMPAYSRVGTNQAGQPTDVVVPECYLIFQVLEHYPETVKPFEEAVPLIAPTVAYAAMMERLRDQHGVVIYEDKLPSPGGGTSTMLQDR